MSGWLRIEGSGPLGWASALAELQAAGVPLPPALAVVDLRAHQDAALYEAAPVRFPSALELARRWGWGHKRVRLLMLREAEWSDPRRLEEWRRYRGQAEGKPRASEGQAEGKLVQLATPSMTAEGQAEGKRRASEGQAEGNARAVNHPHPSPSPSPLAGVLRTLVEVEPSTPPSPAPAVAAVWAAYQALHPHAELGDAERTATKARLRSSGLDKVLLMLDWAHRAPHERASWLREKKCLGLITLLKPKTWGERIEWARQWDAAGRPLEVEHPARAGPRPRQERRSEVEIWQEIRSEQGWGNGDN